MHGGDINDVFKVETPTNKYCLKLNSADKFPGMFEAELDDLKSLGQCGALTVPNPIMVGQEQGHSFLLMDFIEPGPRTAKAEQSMGKGLAALHQMSSDLFGWHQSNYIGSLPQMNTQLPSWAEFFIESRLMPQIERADALLTHADRSAFDSLFNTLEERFPQEKPALLHGDLWGGNWMATANETACIYDPAVYYGHREMDIAMTRLFGGFGVDFYESYNESFPLESGWQERVQLCNLYPLLVHVNLFGAGYLSQVRDILSNFT